MEQFEYRPLGVCSKKMIFTIDNDIIKDIKVIGGCPGNLLGINALVKDRNIDDVISKLSGIKCAARPTSCPDQIAEALKEYKNKRA